MRICTITLAMILVSTMGCGGNNKLVSSAGLSGAYEFVATSNVNGSVTLVEANLAASGNQSAGNGPSQVQVLSLQKKNWYVNGICPGANPGQNSAALTVNDNNVSLTFTEGGTVLPGQGVLTGATVTGNYSITGATCPVLLSNPYYPPGMDSGGFIGNQVPPLAGTFSGSLNLPDGTDDAAFTLTESSNNTLSISAQLTGPIDNGTFILTGSAVGNIMFVSGEVNGQTLSLFGYYDRAGTYTGMTNSILVFNYNTLADVGLLLGQ